MNNFEKVVRLSYAFLVLVSLGWISLPLIQSQLPREICSGADRSGSPLFDDATPQPSPLRTALPGDIEALEAATYTKDDIISRDPDGTYRILIVPVGYQDEYLAERMDPLVADLEKVMDEYGLNVRYAYLDHSLPIEINWLEDGTHLVLANQDVVNELVWNRLSHEGIYTFHTMSVFVYVGPAGSTASGSTYQTISGVDDILYAVLHETGHNLSLSDGYFRQYDIDEIKSGVNTELFTDQLTLTSEKREALTASGSAIVPTKYLCGGKTVFTAAGGQDSVMVGPYNDYDLIKPDWIKTGIFTPYQVALMQAYIADKLSESP